MDGKVLGPCANIVAANVYLGAEPIARAFDEGAEIVVTGRVADPALALGPLVHTHRWDWTDWQRLAAGTLAGHLLECAGQVTGGYFADPGRKDVPGLAELGYPIAEVEPSGELIITKPVLSGGIVDRRTVAEQILYEVHDPSAYLTPDVILDITDVEVMPVGPDRVRVVGARGKPRPETLKATAFLAGGMLGEAEISYAGPNALARARLAADIVTTRMAKRMPQLQIRVDLVGRASLFGTLAPACSTDGDAAPEVRLRFAAQHAERGPLRGSVLLGPRRRGGSAPLSHASACECFVPDRARQGHPERHIRERIGMSRNIEVALCQLAHARSGDKGNRLNIALICYDPAFYTTIAEQATAERVAAHFVARRPSKVVRYELPKLCAFNYVLDDVLEGGVNASLGLDGHGKSLSFFLLTMKIGVNAALLTRCTTPEFRERLQT
jgi:hypothetical protein